MTSYGRTVCIFYTTFGLIMALVLQQILHRLLIPIIYNLIGRVAVSRYMMLYSTKQRSFSVAFLFVLLSICFIFVLIPTLFIYYKYAPQWSFIQLTYFLITTNHLIGFGDFMPCIPLHGQHRSNCAIIMTSKSNEQQQRIKMNLISSVCNCSSFNSEYSQSYVLDISYAKSSIFSSSST